MIQSGLPFSLKDREIKELMASGAALRRAVAKIGGLLRTGRNRRKPYSKSLFHWEGAGGRWTLPEEQP